MICVPSHYTLTCDSHSVPCVVTHNHPSHHKKNCGAKNKMLQKSPLIDFLLQSIRERQPSRSRRRKEPITHLYHATRRLPLKNVAPYHLEQRMKRRRRGVFEPSDWKLIRSIKVNTADLDCSTAIQEPRTRTSTCVCFKANREQVRRSWRRIN